MITVKFTKYYNDYKKERDSRTFSWLDELADWLFEIADHRKDRITFIDPDWIERDCGNGPLHLDSSCLSARDMKWDYWVHLIENENGIIYSDGTLTNRQCHWSKEVKQWFRDCRQRAKNPVFNFAE